MILIPEFEALIAPYLNSPHPHWEAFLHHLFPASVGFPDEKGPKAAGGVGSGYPKVAFLGYWSVLAPEKYEEKFLDALDNYLGRQLENELLIVGDVPGLLGISLGVRDHGSAEQQKQWTRQLARWGHGYQEVPPALTFADCVVRKEIPPKGKLLPPYAIYLILAYGEGEMRHAERVKDFFVQFRKQPWPGPEEELPFKVLAIHGLDACFRRCIWEEDRVRAWKAEALADVRAGKAEALAGVRDNVEHLAHRQGRWLMVLVYLLGIPIIGFCTTYFFQQLDAHSDWQDQWTLLQQALTFLGGPLTVALLLVGLGFELMGRHPVPLKPSALAKYFADTLVRRRSRRLGIESQP